MQLSCCCSLKENVSQYFNERRIVELGTTRSIWCSYYSICYQKLAGTILRRNWFRLLYSSTKIRIPRYMFDVVGSKVSYSIVMKMYIVLKKLYCGSFQAWNTFCRKLLITLRHVCWKRLYIFIFNKKTIYHLKVQTLLYMKMDQKSSYKNIVYIFLWKQCFLTVY